MVVSVSLDDVDVLLHHQVHLLVCLDILLAGVGAARLDLLELSRNELMPGLQGEINGLRVEPADLVDNRAGERVVQGEVPSGEEHVEDLGDPEEPDPGRHLVEILLQGVDYLSELRRV